MTHDNGIIYENEVASVQELEIETKPYGWHSVYIVIHKTMSCVPKRFDESDPYTWNAKKEAINFCDSYVRQVVV